MRLRKGYIYAIFSDRDFEKVDNILLDLFRRGFEVRYTTDSDTDEHKQRLIAGCRVTMAMLTAGAMDNPDVMHEVELANALEKQIVPFYLEDPSGYYIPERLLMLADGVSSIPYYMAESYPAALRRAAAELNKFLPPPKKKKKRALIWAAIALIAASVGLGIYLTRGDDAVERLREATVQVMAGSPDKEDYSTGSGFFVSGDCRIVTNYHVLEGYTDYAVKLTGENDFYTAELIAADQANDLAILKLNGRTDDYLRLSNAELKTGDRIYVAGYPKGIDLIVSDGIISNPSHYSEGLEYFAVTASVSPGNSGGPVVNEEGRVVGVTTAKYTDADDLNLARSVKYIRLLLDKADR